MSKILLIEDDADQIMMYQAKFELSGHDFLAAENGLEGLKKAKQEKPDIILIDLLMEKMGGLEVLEKLKKEEKTKDIPAIVVTNLNKQEMAKKAMNLGALDFIVKSKIPLREMMARIERFLDK
ncbi:MAG: response regulator [Patescibacteria group bacterium]|nr:response regulator [Patescibacteria group bacterium]